MSASPQKIGVSDELEVQPYSSGVEHLLDELERLRWILLREVARLRAANLLREDQFRGLYISDEQIDAVLRGAVEPDAANNDPRTPFPEARLLSARVSECAQQIAARCAAKRVGSPASTGQACGVVFSKRSGARGAFVRSRS